MKEDWSKQRNRIGCMLHADVALALLGKTCGLHLFALA
jgi:hypothetical protein